MHADDAVYKVYGLDLSYFTGKLEAYLRYKGIPYRRVELSSKSFRDIVLDNTGLMKMPAVETPDGVWLTDTTPMIQWFEDRYPHNPILPEDPYAAFFCRLVEDYADEWMWRPALHYRWSYAKDATLMARRIAEEMLHDAPGPTWLKSWMIKRRQIKEYVTGDGITPETAAHVESIYLKTLDTLQRQLSVTPFLLGGRPCLADFGFFASMFRHFGIDPTPARIMRDRAPAVYEWTGRMWNARASQGLGPFEPAVGIPPAWANFLKDIGTGYLPYLNANATAWGDGRTRFDVEIDGVSYRNLPTSQYRVWCLEQLRHHFASLDEDIAKKVRQTMETHRLWGSFVALDATSSNYDPESLMPLGSKLREDAGGIRKIASQGGSIWGRPVSRPASK